MLHASVVELGVVLGAGVEAEEPAPVADLLHDGAVVDPGVLGDLTRGHLERVAQDEHADSFDAHARAERGRRLEPSQEPISWYYDSYKS